MNETTTYHRALETKVSRVQAGEGYLEVHTKFVSGEKILEVFTLASLADVLGMPMTTIEGRYARARLHYWKVDVPTGSGRPTRGFHMAQLEQVVHAIRTPGAKVDYTPNGDNMRVKHRAHDLVPLVPKYFCNKPHYTLQSIADHFGFSVTTIRNKLQRAGLMRRLVNLGSSEHGGRPTRAMPESAMDDVKLAIVDGVKFMTEIDRVLASSGRAAAKDYIKDNVASHTPPSGMRAFDQSTLAPVIPINPLNGVKSIQASRGTPLEDLGLDAFAAELEGMLTKGIGVPAAAAPAPSASDIVAALVGGAHTTTNLAQDEEPAMSDDEKAERLANQRRMKQMQFDALVDADEEPTAGELRETAEMLELSKPDADRFIAEVKAARAQRT